VNGTDSVPMIRWRRDYHAPQVTTVSSVKTGDDDLAPAAPTGLAQNIIRLLRQVGACWTLGWRHKRSARRGHGTALRPRGEWLESRQALSAGVAMVVMDSATTTDSRSVTIDYNVTTPPDDQHPLTFGVYRSADNTFSPDDIAVGSESVVAPAQGTPTLDDNRQPASAAGHHQLTIPLPNGLSLNPKHPYVLVVANPGDTGPAQAPPTASFRTYTIGVVTHGGLENKSWKNGPMWELVMAYSLKQQGYDAVIPYNWVSQSSTPGAAAKQGPRLAAMVLKAVNQAPPNEPVDIHFIGHSEGTVVNSLAIARLEKEATPQMKAGYLEDTLLDPHAANNSFTGQQYSVAGMLGPLATSLVKGYQSLAKDPLAFVPVGVDQAEVFYQHTKATPSGIYNLWGQVPVRGSASYFNLTASGATHSGKTGVMAWYQNNIVPTLGDGAPELSAQTLSGALDPTERIGGAGTDVVDVAQPRYSGTAGAGSTIRLYAGPASQPSIIAPVGQTVAGPDGTWSITTRPLADGNYRVVAVSTPPRRHSLPRFVMNPTAPLGKLVVASKPTL
jgi:hypothetical protein